MTIHMARFLDVADGLQPGQFTIGTVSREISEDDSVEGARVTAQLDHIWPKYTGNAPPYGLRDPSLNEPKVLFELTVDRTATFGRP